MTPFIKANMKSAIALFSHVEITPNQNESQMVNWLVANRNMAHPEAAKLAYDMIQDNAFTPRN